MDPRHEEAARRKRTMRLAIVLGIVALAFYFGFILMSVMKGNP